MIFSRESDLRNDAEQLKELCYDLSASSLIAFDTEFIAEDTYRPELCLVQVATESILAVIDPLACGPIDIFWDLLSEPSRQTIVHSGREEILFHYRATGQLIPSLFDIQIAAVLSGLITRLRMESRPEVYRRDPRQRGDEKRLASTSLDEPAVAICFARRKRFAADLQVAARAACELGAFGLADRRDPAEATRSCIDGAAGALASDERHPFFKWSNFGNCSSLMVMAGLAGEDPKHPTSPGFAR